MADIAVVFHWSLQSLCDMGLVELVEWRERAIELHNKINQPSQ